jgi:hypothetical protein
VKGKCGFQSQLFEDKWEKFQNELDIRWYEEILLIVQLWKSHCGQVREHHFLTMM